MSQVSKVAGYIVIVSGEVGPMVLGTYERGNSGSGSVLCIPHARGGCTVFATRDRARAAILRTKRYSDAHGLGWHTADMRIVRLVEPVGSAGVTRRQREVLEAMAKGAFATTVRRAASHVLVFPSMASFWIRPTIVFALRRAKLVDMTRGPHGSYEYRINDAGRAAAARKGA